MPFSFVTKKSFKKHGASLSTKKASDGSVVYLLHDDDNFYFVAKIYSEFNRPRANPVTNHNEALTGTCLDVIVDDNKHVFSGPYFTNVFKVSNSPFTAESGVTSAVVSHKDEGYYVAEFSIPAHYFAVYDNEAVISFTFCVSPCL